MIASPRSACCWLAGAALLGSIAAASPADEPSPVHGSPKPATIIPGIFTTELPDLLTPENLRLTLRPHFGDFVNHDHLRLTVGARYGLTENLELTAEAGTYIAHGLGDAHFGEKFGLSELSFGAKYRFEHWLQPYWKTAAGLKYSLPVSRPPLEFAGKYRNLTPYVTFAHDWASRPDLTTFFSTGVNFVDQARPIGNPDARDFGEHSWFLRPGIVWRQGDFVYTLETVLSSSTGFENDGRWQVSVRPGVEWTLPPRYRFGSRNRWVIGLGLQAGEGDLGGDYGVSMRVQTDFDFKRLFHSR